MLHVNHAPGLLNSICTGSAASGEQVLSENQGILRSTEQGDAFYGIEPSVSCSAVAFCSFHRSYGGMEWNGTVGALRLGRLGAQSA